MQTIRNCYVFVHPEYSDWEPALAMYGLARFTDIEVVTFSIDGQPLRSGGNLPVVPDKSMADIRPEDIDLLVLPGGEQMEKNAYEAIVPLLQQHVSRQKPLAAICGATVFLAFHGFLDKVRHTGNHPEFLKMMAPAYQGAALYENTETVTDKNIITAPGTAMVPFARAIFDICGQQDNQTLQFWFGFFRQGTLPEIKEEAPMHFFYRSYETTYAGLLPLVRSVAKEVFRDAVANGLEITGPQHWHYYGADGNPDTVFQLHIGVPVAALLSVPAPYECKTLPAFRSVSLTLNGPWDQLGDTYHKLFTGLQLAGMTPGGINREQYVRCDFEQPDANVTIVQVGIQ